VLLTQVQPRYIRRQDIEEGSQTNPFARTGWS
jgi:hypothetical protein